MRIISHVFRLPKFPRNIFLCKAPSFCLQHRCDLFHAHADLVTDGHQASCQMQVVLAQEPVSDHEIVNVAEDEGLFACVARFLVQKAERVIAPVAARVQVVRGVVAVIEAEAVTLLTS